MSSRVVYFLVTYTIQNFILFISTYIVTNFSNLHVSSFLIIVMTV